MTKSKRAIAEEAKLLAREIDNETPGYYDELPRGLVGGQVIAFGSNGERDQLAIEYIPKGEIASRRVVFEFCNCHGMHAIAESGA